jgi:hypothetical protein
MVNENLIAARLVQKPIHSQPFAMVSFDVRGYCGLSRTLIHLSLTELIWGVGELQFGKRGSKESYSR